MRHGGRKFILVAMVGVLMFVAFLSGGVWAQGFFSFMKGNGWQVLPQSAQIAYITGVVDTLGLIEYTLKLGKPQGLSERLSHEISCLDSRKVTLGQIYQVVRKWMGENPEKWDGQMSIIVWASVGRICP